MGSSQRTAGARTAENAGEPVPHADFSFFNVHTETTSQAIAAFCLLDKIPDMELLSRRVEEELERSFPRFSQVLITKPRPRLMPAPNFDAGAHISLVRNPAITDIPALMAEASREFSRPLDMSRPLWRIVVICGQDRANVACEPAGLLFLLHHSLTDGLGALEALYAFCGDRPKSERSVRAAGEQTDSDWGSARGPLARLALAARCARRIFRETTSKPCASPLNGPNSSDRSGCLIRLSRHELRKIGARLGGNLHDTLMTLLAGGLHRFHIRAGYPVGELRAVVPVSIRRSEQREEMSNLITAVGIRMPISHTRSSAAGDSRGYRAGQRGREHSRLPAPVVNPRAAALGNPSRLLGAHVSAHQFSLYNHSRSALQEDDRGRKDRSDQWVRRQQQESRQLFHLRDLLQ